MNYQQNVLAMKISQDKVLHETVKGLDEAYQSFRDQNFIPVKAAKSYQDIQKIGQILLGTTNRVVAAALDKEKATTLLIELDMPGSDEIFGAVGVEVDDLTKQIKQVHLEPIAIGGVEK